MVCLDWPRYGPNGITTSTKFVNYVHSRLGTRSSIIKKRVRIWSYHPCVINKWNYRSVFQFCFQGIGLTFTLGEPSSSLSQYITNPFITFTQADSTTPTYSIRRGVTSTRESPRDPSHLRQLQTNSTRPRGNPAGRRYSTGLLRKFLRDLLNSSRNDSDAPCCNSESRTCDELVQRLSRFRPPNTQLRPRLFEDLGLRVTSIMIFFLKN